MIFSFFDIFILAIFSISSLLGLYRGMIHITVNLLGFIASIIAAIFLYYYVRVFLSEYIANDLVTTIASVLASYIISLIVCTILTSKIILLFGSTSKGGADRILGLAIGIIRGALISVILFAIIAIFTAGTYSDVEETEDVINELSMDKYPAWLKDSVTTPYLEKTVKSMSLLIPKSMWESIKIPQKSEDEDIIDAIKRRKNEDIKVTSEVEVD